MVNYFKLHQGKPYLSETYLYHKGVSQDLLTKLARKFAKSTSSLCAYFQEGKIKWFLYRALPAKWIKKYSLPVTVDEFHLLHQMQMEDQTAVGRNIIYFILNNAWNDSVRWKRFVEKYRSYYLDHDLLIKYAKTHALFYEIISLRERFQMRVIFNEYRKFEYTIFQTKNLNSFRNKIAFAIKNSIENSLIHDFRINGREPTKVDGFLLSRVKYYYSLPKKLTYPMILLEINNERIERGMCAISISTLKRILKNRELRNVCDPLRFGKDYAQEYIYPYLNRKEPEFAELVEIDSTRINIPCLSSSGKKIFLFLCVAMEVYSRSIIGYSLCPSENVTMILSCLKRGLENLGFPPKQILHDNHKSYFSSQYRKFSKAAFELGIDFRTSKIGNARDKAHVERWFGTFQTEFTNSLYGSLGEGVKTSRVGGRVAKEWEEIYNKKVNLRSEEILRRLIKVLISKYNSKARRNGKSPNDLIKEANKSNLKPLDKTDFVRLFCTHKIKQVRNSQITLTVRNKPYIYKIENRIVANKVNGSEVMVMYDPQDLVSVYVFNKTGKEYIADLNLEMKINPVTKAEDRPIISKHYWSLRKRINENLRELEGEIEKGEELLEATPIVSLNPKSRLDEVLNHADNKLSSMQAFKIHHIRNKTGKRPSRDRELAKLKRRSVKVRKGSLKKIG